MHQLKSILNMHVHLAVGVCVYTHTCTHRHVYTYRYPYLNYIVYKDDLQLYFCSRFLSVPPDHGASSIRTEVRAGSEADTRLDPTPPGKRSEMRGPCSEAGDSEVYPRPACVWCGMAHLFQMENTSLSHSDLWIKQFNITMHRNCLGSHW